MQNNRIECKRMQNLKVIKSQGAEESFLTIIPTKFTVKIQHKLVLWVKSLGPGLSLSFDSPVHLIFTPVTNLLLYG